MSENNGLSRFYKSCDTFQKRIDELKQQPPGLNRDIQTGILSLLLERDMTTIDHSVNKKPFISSWYASAPEIYAAMDIHYFDPVTIVLQQLVENDWKELEECDRLQIPDDICSLIRLSSYAVKAQAVPRPDAVIALLQPCDALRGLHDSYRNGTQWRDLPVFGLDSVYSHNLPPADRFNHYANELEQMISFLKSHTGKDIDYVRLRNVIDQTNRQYALWSEYNELRRAVPCPGASFEGTSVFFVLTQGIRSGNPKATKLLEMFVSDTEEKVRNKTGYVQNEQIRILWADIVPAWAHELTGWLADEWGATIVMDWQSYAPYTMIDTSTKESMLYGLAKRSLTETMMIRQNGPVRVMLDDAAHIIRDYSIDCVISPGHMGHKDQSGTIGFLRELARDMEVPFLSFTSSLFDPYYMSVDRIKHRISEFFSAFELGSQKKPEVY